MRSLTSPRDTLAAVLLLLVTRGAHAAADPGLTAAPRAEDPRLEQKVTLKCREVPLGELLEQVRARTGVAVSAREEDGSSDVPVLAVCKDVPLADVMNALWSLVSYKGAEWEWRRTGKPGQYAYELRGTTVSGMFAAKMKRFVSDRLSTVCEGLICAAGGSYEQQRSALRAFIGDDADRMPPELWSSTWVAVQCMRDCLSRDARQRLYDGTAQTASMATLTPAMRESVKAEFRRGMTGHDSITDASGAKTIVPTPDPAIISFRLVPAYGMPNLLVVPQNSGSVSLAGGAELIKAYRRAFVNAWMMDVDAADDESARRRVVGDARPVDPLASQDAVARGPAARRAAFLRRLEQLATGARIPVFARTPQHDIDWDPADPVGRTVADYWSELQYREIAVKWHAHALLVTCTTWPVENPPVRLALLRQLRGNARPGEFMRLADMCAAADGMSLWQMRLHQPEFPCLEGVASARPLLAHLHRNSQERDAASRTGGRAQLTPALVEALLRLPLVESDISFRQLLQNGTARYLAIREGKGPAPVTPAEPRSRGIDLLLLGEDGKYLVGLGYCDYAQPSRPAEVQAK